MTYSIPSFGFSRWDSTPKRDESTVGFFCHMVAGEGEVNTRHFMAMNDMSPKSFHAEDIIAFLDRHPFPDSVKAMFRRSSLVPAPSEHKLRGRYFALREETLNYEDINLITRRWCRACLRESPHRRLWCDLNCIKVCPYHGLPLEDKINGRALHYYRAGFDEVIDDGLPSVQRDLRVGSFGHYILGRLDCEDRFPAPFLDNIALCDVIDAVELIGSLLSRSWPRRTPGRCRVGEAEVGFEAMKHGPAHLAIALRDWGAAHSPNAASHTRTESLFPWSYAKLEQMRDQSFAETIRKVMHVASGSLVGVSREITDDYVNSSRITMGEASRLLEVENKTFSAVSKELGLVAPAITNQRRLGVATCDLQTVTDYFDALVGRKELVKVLGMNSWYPFVRAGMLRMYKGSVRGVLGPRFHRGDVEAVIKRFREIPCTGSKDAGRSFRKAAKLRNQTAGDLAVSILKGDVNVAGVDKSQKGFRSLVVETSLALKEPYRMGKEEITATEASTIIGMPNRILRGLSDAGLIRVEVQPSGLRIYQRTDIERFADSHVSSGVAGEAVGLWPWEFGPRMALAGVEPVVKIQVGKSLGTFYRREDVWRALEIENDPLVIAPKVEKFWETLYSAVQAKLPFLRLPTKYRVGGCWAATAYVQTAVKFIHDPARNIVSAQLRPIKYGGIRFEFALDTKPSAKVFAPLFEALQKANDIQKAQATAKRKAMPSKTKVVTAKKPASGKRRQRPKKRPKAKKPGARRSRPA